MKVVHIWEWPFGESGSFWEWPFLKVVHIWEWPFDVSGSYLGISPEQTSKVNH